MSTAVLAGALVAGVLVVGAWARRDYRAWRDLGPGGLPPTAWGWVCVSALRVVALLPGPSRSDAGAPSEPVAFLPRRAAPRPTVAPHPVPHRVLDQQAPTELVVALQQELEELARRPGLRTATSRWERHHAALWRGDADEIAHVHPVDGSCHVVLPPADLRTVQERAWGVAHPLAGRGGLPSTYTLLFPPRDATEAGHVVAVLRASADAVLGACPSRP